MLGIMERCPVNVSLQRHQREEVDEMEEVLDLKMFVPAFL